MRISAGAVPRWGRAGRAAGGCDRAAAGGVRLGAAAAGGRGRVPALGAGQGEAGARGAHGRPGRRHDRADDNRCGERPREGGGAALRDDGARARAVHAGRADRAGRGRDGSPRRGPRHGERRDGAALGGREPLVADVRRRVRADLPRQRRLRDSRGRVARRARGPAGGRSVPRGAGRVAEGPVRRRRSPDLAAPFRDAGPRLPPRGRCRVGGPVAGQRRGGAVLRGGL